MFDVTTSKLSKVILVIALYYFIPYCIQWWKKKNPIIYRSVNYCRFSIVSTDLNYGTAGILLKKTMDLTMEFVTLLFQNFGNFVNNLKFCVVYSIKILLLGRMNNRFSFNDLWQFNLNLFHFKLLLTFCTSNSFTFIFSVIAFFIHWLKRIRHSIQCLGKGCNKSNISYFARHSIKCPDFILCW